MSFIDWVLLTPINLAAGVLMAGIVAFPVLKIIKRYHMTLFALLRAVFIWLLIPGHIRQVIEISKIIYQVSLKFGLIKGDVSKANHLAATIGAGIKDMPKEAVELVQTKINEAKGELKSVSASIGPDRSVSATLDLGGIKVIGGWNPANNTGFGGVNIPI